MGVRVPRQRLLRKSLLRVDPIHSFVTQLHTVERRTDGMPNANSLWHIAIWVALFHTVENGGYTCGIDGHKRLIVYLKCSNNNRAATVGQCCIEATERFGWPSPVRSDKGDKSIDVALNSGDPSDVSVPCKLYFIPGNKYQNVQNMYAKLNFSPAHSVGV